MIIIYTWYIRSNNDIGEEGNIITHTRNTSYQYIFLLLHSKCFALRTTVIREEGKMTILFLVELYLVYPVSVQNADGLHPVDTLQTTGLSMFVCVGQRDPSS